MITMITVITMILNATLHNDNHGNHDLSYEPAEYLPSQHLPNIPVSLHGWNDHTWLLK